MSKSTRSNKKAHNEANDSTEDRGSDQVYLYSGMCEIWQGHLEKNKKSSKE